MHCVASRFGYPNYRLSELSMVPISSNNQLSTVIVMMAAHVTGLLFHITINIQTLGHIDMFR